LTAALFLTRAGVPVTVLESRAGIYDDPRAATFHPPTMEMFAGSGVTDRLHDLGILCPRWQFRGRDEGIIAEFDLGILGDITRYPYRLQCEQHKLVGILTDMLSRQKDCTIEYGAEVEGVSQTAKGVTVTAGGNSFEGAYVIGADGGRSVVRKSQNIDFAGFTYQERFLVVTTTTDFEQLGFAYSCYVSDPREWCALFKVPAKGPPGLWRVVFPTEPEATAEELLDHANAERRLQGFIPSAKPHEIVHTNLYTVHQRVAATYRAGRALLAGDAAHVNNPLGGMGLNGGIHDAFNLAGKLIEVIRGAPLGTLERYSRQRRKVALDVVQQTALRNRSILNAREPQARRAYYDELRGITRDPEQHRNYLLRTSMIQSLRDAERIQ
jgi:3-(3-hydroxy-phenyl)propionate hydroxylase